MALALGTGPTEPAWVRKESGGAKQPGEQLLPCVFYIKREGHNKSSRPRGHFDETGGGNV